MAPRSGPSHGLLPAISTPSTGAATAAARGHGAASPTNDVITNKTGPPKKILSRKDISENDTLFPLLRGSKSYEDVPNFEEDKEEAIRVCTRLRPLFSNEIDARHLKAWDVKRQAMYLIVEPPSQLEIVESKQAAANGKGSSLGLKRGPEKTQGQKDVIQRTYVFDRCFDDNVHNEEVFEYVAKDIVLDTFRGINGCVFAYGQTGSGKTHTIMGGVEDPGILPRSLAEFFDCIDDPSLLKEEVREAAQQHAAGITEVEGDEDAEDETAESTEYLMRVSYLEIYLERVNDLLQENPKGGAVENLEVKEDPKKGFVVAGLHEETVTTMAEAMSLITKAEQRRHFARTNFNETSSRSHVVFSVTLESTRTFQDGMSVSRRGELKVVDLAGNERVGRASEGVENARQIMEEGKAINKSLFLLSEVIAKLSKQAQLAAEGVKGKKLEKEVYVPWRDSKLTRILQKALGGNSRASVLVAIHPSNMHLETSFSSLRFALKCKSIKKKIRVNFFSPEQSLIAQQKKLIGRLQAQLKFLAGAGLFDSLPQRVSAPEQDEEVQKLKIDLENKIAKFQHFIMKTATPAPRTSGSSFSRRKTIRDSGGGAVGLTGIRRMDTLATAKENLKAIEKLNSGDYVAGEGGAVDVEKVFSCFKHPARSDEGGAESDFVTGVRDFVHLDTIEPTVDAAIQELENIDDDGEVSTRDEDDDEAQPTEEEEAPSSSCSSSSHSSSPSPSSNSSSAAGAAASEQTRPRSRIMEQRKAVASESAASAHSTNFAADFRAGSGAGQRQQQAVEEESAAAATAAAAGSAAFGGALGSKEAEEEQVVLGNRRSQAVVMRRPKLLPKKALAKAAATKKTAARHPRVGPTAEGRERAKKKAGSHTERQTDLAGGGVVVVQKKEPNGNSLVAPPRGGVSRGAVKSGGQKLLLGSVKEKTPRKKGFQKESAAVSAFPAPEQSGEAGGFSPRLPRSRRTTASTTGENAASQAPLPAAAPQSEEVAGAVSEEDRGLCSFPEEKNSTVLLAKDGVAGGSKEQQRHHRHTDHMQQLFLKEKLRAARLKSEKMKLVAKLRKAKALGLEALSKLTFRFMTEHETVKKLQQRMQQLQDQSHYSTVIMNKLGLSILFTSGAQPPAVKPFDSAESGDIALSTERKALLQRSSRFADFLRSLPQMSEESELTAAGASTKSEAEASEEDAHVDAVPATVFPDIDKVQPLAYAMLNKTLSQFMLVRAQAAQEATSTEASDKTPDQIKRKKSKPLLAVAEGILRGDGILSKSELETAATTAFADDSDCERIEVVLGLVPPTDKADNEQKANITSLESAEPIDEKIEERKQSVVDSLLAGLSPWEQSMLAILYEQQDFRKALGQLRDFFVARFREMQLNFKRAMLEKAELSEHCERMLAALTRFKFELLQSGNGIALDEDRNAKFGVLMSTIEELSVKLAARNTEYRLLTDEYRRVVSEIEELRACINSLRDANACLCSIPQSLPQLAMIEKINETTDDTVARDLGYDVCVLQAFSSRMLVELEESRVTEREMRMCNARLYSELVAANDYITDLKNHLNLSGAVHARVVSELKAQILVFQEDSEVKDSQIKGLEEKVLKLQKQLGIYEQKDAEAAEAVVDTELEEPFQKKVDDHEHRGLQSDIVAVTNLPAESRKIKEVSSHFEGAAPRSLRILKKKGGAAKGATSSGAAKGMRIKHLSTSPHREAVAAGSATPKKATSKEATAAAAPRKSREVAGATAVKKVKTQLFSGAPSEPSVSRQLALSKKRMAMEAAGTAALADTHRNVTSAAKLSGVAQFSARGSTHISNVSRRLVQPSGASGR